MSTLLQDLRYGARMLLKKPSFTLIAIITLALGIGANTAIFSVVNAVLLRPLPYKDPAQLAILWERKSLRGFERNSVAGHEYPEWKRQNHVFEEMAAITWSGGVHNLTGTGDPAVVYGPRVAAEFFSVMGVQPILGRTFQPEEDQAGANRVVILSYSLWQNRFGGEPGVIGRNITLNDQSYSVVGVMPSQFQYPPNPLTGEGPQLWTPIAEPIYLYRGRHFLGVIARLKAGVTLMQAQSDMNTIAARLEREQPADNTGHGINIVALHGELVKDVRRSLLILLGAVGFVLLLGCANVANLLLARAAGRQREIAIRTALGAGRFRLMRQLLTESLLLALLAGGIGLMLSYWLLDLLVVSSPVAIPRLVEANIDGRILAMTTGLSLLTGVLFGLAPAFQTSRVNVNTALKEEARTSGSPGRQWVRNLLAATELALAVVLLIGAGLMMRSFARLLKVDPGFSPENVLSMDVALPNTRYQQAHQKAQFYEQVFERIKALPGVQSVGAINGIPLGGTDSSLMFAVEGRPDARPGEEPSAQYRIVSHNYFSVMRIPLLKGRFFQPADARVALPLIRWYPQQPFPARFDEPQAPPAVVINEALARRYWPDEDPVGKRIRVIFSPWLTIVGVVGNTRQMRVDSEPEPELSLLDLQEPQGQMTLVIRTAGDPSDLAAPVRQQIWGLDRNLPVTNVRNLSELFSHSVAQRRFNAILLSIFALVALLLATVGVYGVMNYSVAERSHEIGIRMALGAQAGDVVRMILRQAFKLTLIGMTIGVATAFALTRLMSGLLYEVPTTDPATFILIPLLLAGVTLLASFIPAWRAARVDPLVALRCE